MMGIHCQFGNDKTVARTVDRKPHFVLGAWVNSHLLLVQKLTSVDSCNNYPECTKSQKCDEMAAEIWWIWKSRESNGMVNRDNFMPQWAVNGICRIRPNTSNGREFCPTRQLSAENVVSS